MTTEDRIRQDLDYVTSTVRRERVGRGVPAVYFLWASIVPPGFALIDFFPQSAGLYWCVFGIGGGALSWWLGMRDGRRHGFNDSALGRRYALHWAIAAAGFMLAMLPAAVGLVDVDGALPGFLLVGGLVYALAGVHLERPLLWVGVLMLAAYVVLVLLAPPHLWTVAGVMIALALVWTGIASLRQPAAAAYRWTSSTVSTRCSSTPSAWPERKSAEEGKRVSD